MDALSTTFKKLRNIKEEPSKKNKALLVKSYLSCDIFAKCMLLMFDEKKKFKINELPPTENTDSMDESYIFDFLDSLSKSKGVNDDQKQLLADACGNGMTRKVVERILLKSSDAGFGLRTLNTVAPGMLFETPYQRCSGWAKFSDNGSWPKIVQEKADAQFAYAVTDEFDEPFLSRRGTGYNMMDAAVERHVNSLQKHLHELTNVGWIVMGEMIVCDKVGGEPLPRKTSNGLVNKMMKGKGSQDIADRAVFAVWDIVPIEDFHSKKCNIDYESRWELLQRAKNFIGNGPVYLIDSEEVNSEKEAQKFYDKMRSEGKEGAILKEPTALWKHGTSVAMYKMKHFVEGEFRVIGVVEGKGKYKGKVGSLIYESECGKVLGAVGSGLSDAERDIDYWLANIGGVITVKFESISTSKDWEAKGGYVEFLVRDSITNLTKTVKLTVEPGTKTLYCPSFVETRFNEKTVADTLEYLEGL